MKKAFSSKTSAKNILMVWFAVGTFLLTAATAKAAEIVVTTSIQAAVYQATTGDTILVPPGIYRENVNVNKNGITIRGSRAAILDGEGLTGGIGIRVAPVAPATRINGFRLEGLTIRNYSRHGVFLTRTDNYSITGGFYENNAAYGIYPVRSTNGIVEGNHASGSEDAGIYIGQASLGIIRNNICFDNTVGIEIENSTFIEASDNLARDNSVGIAILLLPGLSIPLMEDTVLKNNTVINNNRPNLLNDPDEILSGLPDGLGILVFGGDRTLVEKNRVIGNNTAGIAVVQVLPDLASQDPRVEPFPDQNTVTDNVVLQNGKNPDERAAPLPGADLIWDLTGTGNSWINNRFQTSFPLLLP